MKHKIEKTACIFFTAILLAAGCAFSQPGSGNCLQFDGVDDYVDYGNSNVFNFGNGVTDFPFTLSVWIKRTTGNAAGALISKYNSQVSPMRQQYALGMDASGHTIIALYQTVQDYRKGIRTVNTIADLSWHHVTATYDGSSNVNGLKIYIDGVPQPSTVIYDNPLYIAMKATTETLKIGVVTNTAGNCNSIPAQIDEVRIWNYARSQTEIREDMCRKLQGNEPGLVGYWRFDEGSGSTAFDSSPNGNDGTLY